jgi:hypothetical protein
MAFNENKSLLIAFIAQKNAKNTFFQWIVNQNFLTCKWS